MLPWTIGVDVGGTFTDAIAIAADGSIRIAKVPSTPADPSVGLADALRELGELGVSLDEVGLLFHGTTVATNALVTGRISRTVLLSTEGFRDVLSYRTGSRPKLYDLEQPRPRELVPRRDRLEVRERLSSTGQVVTPLERHEIDRLVDEIAARSPEAVAVAFLFSYLDDRHERAMGEALRARFPGLPVALSSEVAREFREYPRTATTVLNAGLRPLVGRYVLRADREAKALGVKANFLVMQSNGGCVPAERADREAHRLVLSGPAAGVTGAIALGARHGIDRLIALDMGGTSLDVCLVRDGIPPIAPLQHIDVHPILTPSIDIVTAGAGGGSIASVQRGRLQVGPQSAAADPGPAAYGLGGKEPTLTDAHVVMGTLSEATPLAGRLALDAEAARDAVARIGADLNLGVERAAEGIVEVATAHIVRALRRVSVERGVDPRQYALVAFGGAGPLHAGLVLRELGLGQVLVPVYPGIFSAAGLAAADLRIDESQTVLATSSADLVGELAAWYLQTRDDLLGRLGADGIPRSKTRVVASADCRYLGQGYELNVSLPGFGPRAFSGLIRSFHELHAATYGHADPSEPVEVVTLRISAFGGIRQPEAATIPRGAATPTRDAQAGERPVMVPGEGRRRRVPVFHRERLRGGNRLRGPAIIDQMDSTTFVLPGQLARVDRFANIWIREEGAR